ncbi:c6 zinc finger domain-containing [Trichoderma cornu-damae]|uniref:C6 zinc finger domain-containing n=1 Tax=Trichoderma cornu-damae TaxID=654480 RepID=A0A9P8TXN3_9HYPO|nr:c6 zinc finger domain-containing [Trichoderma cornu-damae]
MSPPSRPAPAPVQRHEPLPFLATALSYAGAAGDGGDSSNASLPPPSVLDGDADGPPSPSPADAAAAARRPGKRPAARGTAFYPRKRANTACQVCRARKTKCDNKKPACSYCVSVGATCIQSPVDLSSFDPASLKILDRIDELERLLRHAVPVPVPVAGGSDAPASSASGHPPPPPSRPPGALDALHGRGSSVSSVSGLRQADDDMDVSSLLPQRVDHILRWPVFQSSGARRHSPASCRGPPDAISTPPSGSASLAGLIDMDSHRIYRLLDSFFLHIHCKNPILDEVLARRMVINAFLDGIDWSPASCLALVICALGCIATPFGPSGETKLGTQTYNDSQIFFQAAQKRIGILLVRSDIVGAQCLFLSGVYLMMVFQPVYAWRFFSQALAACQHFPFLARAQGLHAPLDSMEMGRQDTQEQAVYWSAWKSERELRQELDLPDFDILHSGSTLYPPFFPAPPVAPAESPDGPDSETRRARAAWLFYLAEISLRRLTSRLSREALDLRQRYASDAVLLDMLLDMMPEYEAQVREWSESLPADLSIHTPVEEDGICRSVLRGRMVNLFEQIYWPFVMASIGAHAARRPVKPAVAEFAKRGLETHMHQVHVNKPGFHHRHHGCMFMIRACTRSALVLLAAARAGCAMPADWEDSVHKTAGMLAYWEDEDRDLMHWRATLERELALARA